MRGWLLCPNSDAALFKICICRPITSHLAKQGCPTSKTPCFVSFASAAFISWIQRLPRVDPSWPISSQNSLQPSFFFFLWEYQQAVRYRVPSTAITSNDFYISKHQPVEWKYFKAPLLTKWKFWSVPKTDLTIRLEAELWRLFVKLLPSGWAAQLQLQHCMLNSL